MGWCAGWHGPQHSTPICSISPTHTMPGLASRLSGTAQADTFTSPLTCCLVKFRKEGRLYNCGRSKHLDMTAILEVLTLPLLLLQASASEGPSERRRRLKVEAILPTDPGEDGIAIGLDGQIYSDTAITAAYAAVGQLGPISPKVAICHFPPQERAQFQVCCSTSLHRELCI